jgi:hypothetical protein
MCSSSEILKALGGPGFDSVKAQRDLPSGPGLYAIHGDRPVWLDLGLECAEDGRPLYVGKTEQAILGRVLGTHFSDGQTGSSSLRRSLAALLRTRLGLHGVPRNREKPGHFSSYGLPEADDESLTKWMTINLRISWPARDDAVLLKIEKAVIRTLKPPLNLTHAVTTWTSQVKAARKRMADQAREWVPPH